MHRTRREVLALAGKAAAVAAVAATTGCDGPLPPAFVDVSDPTVRARPHRLRLQYGPTGRGSQTMLSLGVSSGEPIEVDVVTTTGRSLVSLDRASMRSGSERVRLERDRATTVWVQANGVGEPEMPGDRLSVRGPGWTMTVEVWIEPTAGQWRGGGPNGAPLAFTTVAVHAALMHRGEDRAEVVAFSPPRRRDGNGFVRDPDRAGQWQWNTQAMRDVEISVCDLADFSVREQRMEDTPGTERWNLFCAGHAHLPDGRWFVAGGHIAGAWFDSSNADHLHVYDARARSWRRVDGQRMRVSRWYPTVIPLPDGRMLIAGGSGQALTASVVDDVFAGYYAHIHNDYQVFDPATMRLVDSDRDDLISEKDLGGNRLATYPALFALPGSGENRDGVVAIVEANRAWLSGYRPIARKQLKRAERRYDMATRGSRSYPYYGSVVLLPYDADTRLFAILALGGQSETQTDHRRLDSGAAATATAEVFLYDRDRGLEDQPGWQRAGSMATRRVLCDATLLPDGKVLVTGGATNGWANRNGGDVLEAEMYDPASRAFAPVASARAGRRYHSIALLLPDGSVLKAGSHGGFDPNPEWIDARFDAERYLPGYLWRGPRPRLRPLDARAAFRHGGRFSVTAEGERVDAGAKVVVIRCGSVTHGFDMDQRHVRLRADARQVPGGWQFDVAVPADPAVLPPGDYLLFVVDGTGVPSTGKFVRFAR